MLDDLMPVYNTFFFLLNLKGSMLLQRKIKKNMLRITVGLVHVCKPVQMYQILWCSAMPFG
jgi:hypothetical protein